MAHKKGQARAPKIIKIAIWATTIIIFIILITVWFFWGGNRKPTPAQVMVGSEIIWSDPFWIKASAGQWSKVFSVPSGKFGIAVQKGEKAEVLFSNGKYYLLDNYKQIEFGNVSGNFQFRGVNRDVVVYLYTSS